MLRLILYFAISNKQYFVSLLCPRSTKQESTNESTKLRVDPKLQTSEPYNFNGSNSVIKLRAFYLSGWRNFRLRNRIQGKNSEIQLWEHFYDWFVCGKSKYKHVKKQIKFLPYRKLLSMVFVLKYKFCCNLLPQRKNISCLISMTVGGHWNAELIEENLSATISFSWRIGLKF